MSLEFNKIAASVLTAGIAFMGAGIFAEVLIHPKKLSQPAISLGAAPQQAAAPAAAAPAAPAVEPIAPLLANASADNGRQLAQRLCASCHSFNEGGRNAVGPNLWNIVGSGHAQVAGFNYSAANRALADKPWDFEALNAFIAAPARAMPGTRMAFAGLPNPQQRADIIMFLRSNSPNPVPLP
ncbi:c-type cytochrome [Rubritepida flocculans]|uniref:c-type cytochrome n=1 Tax=Rubritepida flocculans TaxID=182403 RepID=UPI000409BEB3|nr:cytochrome c family protein [Rubritepida flocculans]